ncbi:MAG: hypothetical protein ACYCZD_12740 [Rhodanobacter sp.]|jgi:hypothetical protein
MDPVTWIYLIVLVVSLVLSLALAPHIKGQKPAGLGDLSVPTAQDGREVSKIFGKNWIDDPNVINYGNLRTRPIHASSGK